MTTEPNSTEPDDVVESQSPAAEEPSAEASDAASSAQKVKKKRRLHSHMFRGGVWGGGLAISLLAFFAAVVAIRGTFSAVDPHGASDTALTFTTFLMGAVCFGPPFIAICVAIGAAFGFIRWRAKARK
ncbi:MAG: hypothetical protein QGG36_16355 [Pirellulaceae bacterium]|nr:hypothetical protein [Pirellulaceae bacterium]MDP7017378.1 hypothetical protein [Pirellulaceae bacterium]